MVDSIDKSIQAFWRWFEVNSRSFGDNLENQELLDELDDRLSAIGPVEWEVGPGLKDPENNSLAVSPGGDAKLLVLTRRIVSKAPRCAGWEIYSAKPPKMWDRTFAIEDNTGAEVAIDASRWSYYLLQYPDGMTDIVIKAPEMCRLDEETRSAAAWIVLDGELGEELRLTRIHGVEFVSALETGKKYIPITNLKDQIQQLASRTNPGQVQ